MTTNAPSQAHLQGTQNLPHKSQPCKRACLVPTLPGHTLLQWTQAFNSSHPDEGHTYNMGILCIYRP